MITIKEITPRTNIHPIISELENAGYKVDYAHVCYHKIMLTISKGNGSAGFVIYDNKDLIHKKQIINFEITSDGVIFDIERVNKYFERQELLFLKKQQTETISKFRYPLALSFIRGTLDFSNIEYEESKYEFHSIFKFKKDSYSFEFRHPGHSKLAKLNFDQIEVSIKFFNEKTNKLITCPVPLLKFVKDPNKYLNNITNLLKTQRDDLEKLNEIKTEYSFQINNMKEELERVCKLSTELSQKTFDTNLKNLFKESDDKD